MSSVSPTKSTSQIILAIENGGIFVAHGANRGTPYDWVSAVENGGIQTVFNLYHRFQRLPFFCVSIPISCDMGYK